MTGDGQDSPGQYGGDGGLIGAIIQTGGALYDSSQNRKTAKENTNKTIAAQKAEAELAYQRSVQMWNMQNAYNSPEAQMQRFRAAGLNPHLIYGQGNPGNASSPPQYQPANLQYRYEAPTYGAAIGSILPTLMAVGTWMQNMRLSEAELRSKGVQAERGLTETERSRQMIEFLKQRNPQLLKEMENKFSIFPYQRDTADYLSNQARTKLFEMEQNFRSQFGEGLFSQMGSAWKPSGGEHQPIGGLRRLQFLQKEAELEQSRSKSKLLEAQSSWADMDITNPQAIMHLVMSGVLGLANTGLKLRYQKPPVKPVQRPRGLNRRRMSSNHPDR